MTRHWTDWPEEIINQLRAGCVIPASPLALTRSREFDAIRQRALVRYYCDAGAGGLAIGVHTTQFEIRDVGLYRPVLETVALELDNWQQAPIIRIAGIVGRTDQARAEAEIARELGFHAGLLSLAGFQGVSEDELIEHCRAIAAEIPVIGFYLQPAVGGIPLAVSFWRRFSQIENVAAIKIAPFNRYQTLDVVRGVVLAGAEDRITLYTGNDDNIVMDLVSPFRLSRDDKIVEMRIAGGLLGHWSVWTKSAVDIFNRCRSGPLNEDLLALAGQVTDCNAAFFDVANNFKGCIPGIHEILRRQGIFEGVWCLDADEALGPGQAGEIDRVYRSYPSLNDDAFVTDNLDRWLSS